MFRRILAGTAALALPFALSIPADAHASLEKSGAAPGSFKAVLRIPHGCDGKPTDTIRIEIPEGYIGVKPMLKPGWTIAVETGDYAKSYQLHGEPMTSGVKSVTWSGGNLPDGFFDEFLLLGTIAGVADGDTLYLETTQKCGAEEIAWAEIPAAGQNPHELDHPAPAITIADGADEHAGHGAGAAVAAGDLEISGYWAKAMLPGQPAGGGYLSIANKGGAADRLVSVSSPAAGMVEVHMMEIVDDVMNMRPVEGGVEIAPGAMVELKPGGMHLMFMQVKEPFKEGTSVPVTLEFEKAGKVDLALPVQTAAGDDHSQH
jgi:periplasmic copper chaperone A